MSRARLLRLATALLLAGAAAPVPAAEGPWLGDAYRYDRAPVWRRALVDVVAIPADVPRWSAGDAAQVALVLSAGVVLMLPLRDPYDARLDRWITRELDDRVPKVWTEVMQPALWGGLALGGFGTWWWAARHGRPDVAQGMSLMGEALAVAQAYHVTVKLLVGREGPWDGEGRARILGPRASLRLYPAGTPSGHATTLFALTSAGCAYFRPPAWAVGTLYGVATFLVLAHVKDHRHFLSDVVLGAGLGHGVGRWVVLHRAAPAERPRARASIAVVPMPVAGGGGLAIAGAL